jgi:TPR repeat protein
LTATSVLAIAQDVPSPQPTTPAAQVRLGNQYLDEKHYSEAMKWFRQAAEKGDSIAQNNIGWLYQNGSGVGQDYSEAMRWFQKAADQGYAVAQNNLGWLYQNGWGVSKDYAQAMMWYRKAALQGNGKAE